MNNLITIFMNYKINYLVNCGLILLDDDSPFIRKVLKEYISVYVDNYYYNVFYTVDDNKYNEENLKKEFEGMMIEMKDDYSQFELTENNEVYKINVNYIESLKELAFETIKLDSIKINNKEEIQDVVETFVNNNSFFHDKIKNHLSRLIKLVREYYQTTNKLLDYKDNYFEIDIKSFENNKEIKYIELKNNIRLLNNYRKSMVNRVYTDDKLAKKKIECLVQKVSLFVLKNVLDNNRNNKYIIKINDSLIKRSKIDDDIFNLIDNHMFRHYVTLGVSYNVFNDQNNSLSEDFHFACIQDFSHINDIVQKVQNIAEDGIFDYIVVSDYKYKDKEYFLGYEESPLKILMFEEE